MCYRNEQGIFHPYLIPSNLKAKNDSGHTPYLPKKILDHLFKPDIPWPKASY